MARSSQEISIPEVGRGIIKMIATVMTYKFINLTRQEVEAMIGLTFQETRVYKDAKEEGRQEEQLRIVRLFLNQKLGNIA